MEARRRTGASCLLRGAGLRPGPRSLGPLALAVAIMGACVPPSPASSDGAPGLALQWTAESCRSAGSDARDRDEDAVDDDCELALARAFAPELIADPRDCLWDRGARPQRLAGGYLFAVGRAPGDLGAVRIAYLPAYYRDCGWDGLVCATRRAGCSAHDGDSELVVVEARHDRKTGRWITVGVFLSAHCFGRSAGRCRWYREDDLRGFAWADDRREGAPRVWVARGKHGNYPSSGACDTGHWHYDSCDDNSATYRFPVVSAAQNIGSRRRPLPEHAPQRAGCVGASRLALRSSGTDAGASECFWDPSTPFRGWQRTRVGAPPTPYARLLEYAAGF